MKYGKQVVRLSLVFALSIWMNSSLPSWAQLALKVIDAAGEGHVVTGRNVARGEEALVLYDSQ